MYKEVVDTYADNIRNVISKGKMLGYKYVQEFRTTRGYYPDNNFTVQYYYDYITKEDYEKKLLENVKWVYELDYLNSIFND